jgi:hypothetical protein
MKDWSTVNEAAEKTGHTPAYIRELLIKAQYDKSIKLKGVKCGKEWRINSKSINEYLGINIDEESYKKDLYIKELEGKVKTYQMQLEAFKQVAGSLNNIIGL